MHGATSSRTARRPAGASHDIRSGRDAGRRWGGVSRPGAWLAVVVAHVALGVLNVALAGGLRFTEYIEGSGSNKALEIFNDTGGSVDLSTCQVRCYFNGSSSPGLTTALSGTLADGEVFVIAHGAADDDILAVADQTVTGSWFNGDDAVALVRSGVLLDVVGQIGFDPGVAWGVGGITTADHTLRRRSRVTAGDADGSDAFDPAIEWQGLTEDTFSGLGTYPDPEVVAKALAIPQIQGAGHVSPVAGMLVETTGTVTAVDSHGFYLQDPVGDRDPATSDGLFVFTASAPGVVAGNAVRVVGVVGEFQPGGAGSQNLSVTELAEPDVTVLRAVGEFPAPVVVGVAGTLCPTEVIDDDGFSDFDPASDGIDFFETLEGMRVLIRGALAVSARNGFGEIVTVSNGGRAATHLNARSGLTLTAADSNPERIQVQLDEQLTPGFDPAVSTGDSLGDVVGVVSYSFGNYEVLATQPFVVKHAGLQPETAEPVPAPVPGDAQLSIAAFNVHNLDPKLESFALVGSAADIDDDVGSGFFDRLGAQIAGALRSPDILCLEEVQDNDGAEKTAETDASLTYATLIAAIVAAGGPDYAYRDVAPLNGSSGGQPGGNIRVGFLFQPSRVSLDEGSLQPITDGDLRDGNAFQGSRLPLAADFMFRGRKLTVIGNHFASKSGSTPLFGLVQPPINGSVAKRVAQAQVVHDHVAELLAADPAANVIVLGDLNEFSYNEPLAVLKGLPVQILANLTETLPEVERYSFVFDGNAQSLDHILVSRPLARLATYDIVHVNAEFQVQASDHDPVLARVVFRPVCQPDLGHAGPGGVRLAVCGDPLAPSGTASVALSGLPAGAAGVLLVGLTSAPRAARGGTLVPATLIGCLPLHDADRDGLVSFPLPGDLAAEPIALVVQFVCQDARLPPHGAGFSNAVELRFQGW